MANLKVKRDLLDSSVGYNKNGSHYIVKLNEASQAQLKVLHELGVDVFEKLDDKKA